MSIAFAFLGKAPQKPPCAPQNLPAVDSPKYMLVAQSTNELMTPSKISKVAVIQATTSSSTSENMLSAAAGLNFFGPLGTEPPHVYTRKPECPHRIYTHPATTMLSSNAKLLTSAPKTSKDDSSLGMSRYEAQDLKQLLMLAA